MEIMTKRYTFATNRFVTAKHKSGSAKRQGI